MGIFDRIKAGLQKTRETLGNGLSAVLPGRVKLDEALLEELEERLLWSDEVESDKAGPYRIEARSRPLLRALIEDAQSTEGVPGLRPETAVFLKRRIVQLATFNRRVSATAKDDRDLIRAIRGSAAGATNPVDKVPARIPFDADLLFLADGVETSRGGAARLQLLSAVTGTIDTTAICQDEDRPCFERFFAGLEAKWLPKG